MNGECNATKVQGKNYNLHKLQGGGHVPQCPIAGDATVRVVAQKRQKCADKLKLQTDTASQIATDKKPKRH